MILVSVYNCERRNFHVKMCFSCVRRPIAILLDILPYLRVISVPKATEHPQHMKKREREKENGNMQMEIFMIDGLECCPINLSLTR